MSFNGNEGTFITLEEATQWTANFRNSGNYDGIKAQFYGKNKLLEILNQPGCVGIRIYRALDERNNPVLVLVGANSAENDLFTGNILEKGCSCPPFCGGDESPLQG